MSICACCQKVSIKFFSSSRDDQCTIEHHPSVAALKQSAATGCRLCAVLHDSIQRRAKNGVLYSNMSKDPVDPAQQIHLRSTKFAEQWVCVGWSDVGCIRGMEVPPNWDDIIADDAELKLGVSLSRSYQARTLKWWLDNCRANHPDCHKNHDANYAPSRLIDVESSTPDCVRLIATSQITLKDRRYVAASHCWGLNMPHSAKTVTSNINQHMRVIWLKDLPRSFVDFIHISRSIGVRYVWIDSLCIIQDSREDWMIEAAQMAAVYSNAYVTLAASSSSDGSGGCRLGEPDEVHFGPVDLKFNEIDESGRTTHRAIRVFSKPVGHSVNALRQDPLVTRGWTLQERELSPKVAHYSKDTIRWECVSQRATLDYPWGDSLPFDGSLRTFDKNQLTWQSTSNWYTDDNVRKNGCVWFEVIERYTKRSLTRQSDILPAISGIARHFCAKTGDKYHAGLLESHGVTGLIWSIQGEWNNEKNKSSRPEEYLAPSWSWASVKGSAVWYWTLKRAEDPEPVDHSFTPEILDISMVPASSDSFSHVKGGVVKMKGLLVLAAALWRDGDNLQQDQRSVLVMKPEQRLEMVGTIKFDVPSEAHQVIFCLACRRDSTHGWIDALGLVMTGRNQMEFKRVGLIRSKEKWWWDKAPTVEITII